MKENANRRTQPSIARLPHDWRYLELGAGSAAKSKEDYAIFRRALRKGALTLREAGEMEDYQYVWEFLKHEWKQTSSPKWAFVPKRVYTALSRAMRADAYAVKDDQQLRNTLMLGKGNKMYQRWMAMCRRSHSVYENGQDRPSILRQRG